MQAIKKNGTKINRCFHGYVTNHVIVVFRKDDPKDLICFDQEKDAEKYLQIRKDQGLWEYVKVSKVMRIKNGIIGVGPSIKEKDPNCSICQKIEDELS